MGRWPLSFRTLRTRGPDPKPKWRPRKEAYLAELPGKPRSSLLVSLADKVYNAEAIANDYLAHEEAVWGRFTGGAEGTRWYYGRLAVVFAEALPGALADRLGRAVEQFIEHRRVA